MIKHSAHSALLHNLLELLGAWTSWLKAPRTLMFKVSIHRAQRFVHGAWLAQRPGFEWCFGTDHQVKKI